jgi:hypothetical protein
VVIRGYANLLENGALSVGDGARSRVVQELGEESAGRDGWTRYRVGIMGMGMGMGILGRARWMDNGWNIVKRAGEGNGERSKEREALTFCLLDWLRG